MNLKNLNANSDDSYIIAEVGQNHQGSVDIALRYVEDFASLGANAVKFQMRDNKTLFSTEALLRPYDSTNSFGATYGEHREALELTFEEMKRVRERCYKVGVDFMCTPFDEPSLEKLIILETDVLKVASFDLGNLPLLKAMGQTGLPIVMSVGGGNIHDIQSSIEFLLKMNSTLTILHCVSKYPCPYDELNLNQIETISQQYPNLLVGCSDHFNGILSGPVAYMLGARVFEKHVTFDRSQKGSDHSFALEREGFRKFCRDIRRLPKMLNSPADQKLGQEPVFKKLGKSIVAKRHIKFGETLSLENLTSQILVEPVIPVREFHKIIGNKANSNIQIGQALRYEDFLNGKLA